MRKADGGSVLFIGNATTLIRYNGFTLLTDPNFLHRGQRAHLGYGLTSRRLLDPAMEVEDLPPLDAVVLSHLHGDHWDRVARAGLDQATPVITTPHAARRLRKQGFERAVGLRTWQEHQLRNGTDALTVTAVPARHAPGPAEALLPPVMGSVLEFRREGRVDLRLHISGDTLMDRRLHQIPRRFPDLDVGIVHLGGTKLLGALMVTMDGRQGADWVDLISPRRVLPVHYDDYTVFSSGLDDFREHMERSGHADRVVHLDRGDTYTLPVRPPAPART
ncbi:MBL fold metallo-hydrolase [Nonomuraea rhodomycinica]|uniref:MBL fold metallo-hydrolase n=1 Tax=Nonomuraea rhodomycinica TaxID=1712872 RepID=A0A7Y6MD63_9ACTN|nr:MBL fold metallo-hydrolase [Nonomuraea rhodomycinica]NUW44133.1 MBL fold metallo-hydrolase [Nonomuraea rhodomycinica]